MLTGVATRTIGTRDELFDEHALLRPLDDFPTVEAGGLVGLLFVVAGLAWGFSAVANWGSQDFGPLRSDELLRTISLSTALLTIGGILLVFSLLLGFIALPTRASRNTTA